MNLDELKPTLLSLIPDVTAPAMTLDEIVNTIRRKLTEGKALAGYVDQTVARLKAMTNPDVTGLDEGLTLVEAKIEDANQIRAENASLHRIMGRVKAKVNALLLDPREKISDVCQILDTVDVEYASVKERAVKAEALTVDVHQRLCKALHVLVSTPLDQALDQIIRMVEARDYHAKRMLARLCPDVDLTGKTSDQVLSMIEAQHKTVTERLGTSYAREIELTRELAEVKTRLETAGRESADLARALHAAEDKINAQSTRMAEAETKIETLTRANLWAQGTVKEVSMALFGDVLDRGAILRKIWVVIGDRDQAQTRFAELIGALCEALDMPFSGTTPIVEEVGALVTLRKNMRTFLGKEMTDEQLLDQVTQLLTFAGEYRGMSDTLTILRKTLGLGVDCAKDTIVAKVGDLVQERAQTREDLGLAPGQSVDALRTRLCKALGLSEDTSVAKTVNTLSEAFEAMDRVRDAIGLNENASVDYTVQKIADTRRDALWAQGTVKMVREALDIDGDCDRQTILSTIAGLTRASQRAKALRNELIETRDGLADRVSELDMIKDALSLSPATPASEVVDKVKGLREAREWLTTVNHQAMAKALNLTPGMTSDEVARKIVEEVSYLRGMVDGLRGIAVKHRENLLTLLCEAPARAVHMTVDEFQNLLKSKIAALALNLSLPETATLNEIMRKIQGMTPSMLILAELATALGMSTTVGVNEAMRRATDKIKALREGLYTLLNA